MLKVLYKFIFYLKFTKNFTKTSKKTNISMNLYIKFYNIQSTYNLTFKHHRYKYHYNEHKINNFFLKKIDYYNNSFENTIKPIKIKKNFLEYYIVNPIYRWMNKIKITKSYVANLFCIKKQMFKNFIKKNNFFNKLTYFNNVSSLLYFLGLNFFKKKNIIKNIYLNFYNNKNTFSKIELNDVISFNINREFIQLFNNIFKFKTQIINYNKKSNFVFFYHIYFIVKNIEIQYLNMTFFFVKHNKKEILKTLNNILNVNNWKSYAWHTTKSIK